MKNSTIFVPRKRFFATYMKSLLLLFAVFIAVIVGCDRYAAFDSRIATADSMLCVPDSDENCRNAEKAEMILSAISTDSLSDRDLALYSLLMVNARTKNLRQIGNGDDSMITSAVNYFEKHPEANYLARSYLYKGFVKDYIDTTGSGEPLDWYLKGLNMLDSTDCQWRGYAHIRIARYYASNAFVDYVKMISHMRSAIDNYEKSGDILKVEVCCSNLGSYYCTSLNDSCLFYANRAIELSRAIHDDYYYSLSNCTLSAYYCNIGDNKKGNDFAKAAASVGEQYFTAKQPYYYLACSFLGIGRVDSARYYAEKFGIDNPYNAQSLNLKYLLQKKEGHTTDALTTMEEIYRFRTKQLEGNLQRNMMLAELRHEKQKVENEMLAKTNESIRRLLIFVIIGTVLLLTALSAWLLILRQRKRVGALEKKNADLNQQYETEKKATTEIIRRYDAVLSEIEFKGIQRSEENELAMRLPIMTSQQKRKIIDVIRNFMNVKYNGLIDRLKSEGLSDRNIELISLKAYGLSSKTIAAMLGYKDAESVYVTISRVVKRLGANSFNHLLEKFSEGV